ncbi:MAG: tRNA pseudouridine(38-40) synthase TruA [Nitrospirae bacterium]|nr:tRNA pseudouridine(38-40) synthase TruA [Nitrospirota bacterium]
MRNIKLLIEYKGTNYHGWQRQKNGNTLQGIIEDKLSEITREAVKLVGASRTDAGVHAFGQVASFRTDSHLDTPIFRRALNALLPDDIRILDAEDANEDFHPRFSAISKSYFYIINNADVSSAFIYRYSWRAPYLLDLEIMKKAGAILQGRHDFSAFRGAGCGAKNTMREIISLDIDMLNRIDFMTTGFTGRFIKIRIEANAFLRHMVRNIVGTLVEIGRGKMTSDSMLKAFELKDRRLMGITAPANGLFLEEVRY